MSSYINTVVGGVFVINMDQHKERLEKIGGALRAQNVSFERFPGIPGKDIQWDNRLTDWCNETCTDTTKGCALSHRTIWDIAYKRHYEYVIVFEDDAEIPADFQESFRAMWRELPKDFDMLYFGCLYYCNDRTPLLRTLNDLKGDNPEFISNNIMRINGALTSHAYMISRSGIEKLLRHPINWHIDTYITRIAGEDDLKMYASHGFRIGQHDTDNSSNTDKGYPALLKGVLRTIPIGEYFNGEYVSTIGIFKAGGMNFGALAIALFFAFWFGGQRVQLALAAWMVVEFAYAPNLRAAKPYIASAVFGTLLAYERPLGRAGRRMISRL